MAQIVEKKNPNAVALGRNGGRAAWRDVDEKTRSKIMRARAAKRKRRGVA